MVSTLNPAAVLVAHPTARDALGSRTSAWMNFWTVPLTARRHLLKRAGRLPMLHSLCHPGYIVFVQQRVGGTTRAPVDWETKHELTRLRVQHVGAIGRLRLVGQDTMVSPCDMGRISAAPCRSPPRTWSLSELKQGYQDVPRRALMIASGPRDTVINSYQPVGSYINQKVS